MRYRKTTNDEKRKSVQEGIPSHSRKISMTSFRWQLSILWILLLRGVCFNDVVIQSETYLKGYQMHYHEKITDTISPSFPYHACAA